MKKRSTSLIAGIMCLAAAAAWHSLDVRAGIHETGASWQMGRYLLLIVLVLVLTTVCGYFLLEKAVPCSLPKLAVLMTGGLGILFRASKKHTCVPCRSKGRRYAVYEQT